MKKKKMAAFLSVIVVLALAACSNSAGEVTAMENSSSADASNNELLIDSLEYLLLDEEERAEDIQGQEAGQQEQQEQQKQEETQQMEVMIYYGNGASDELKTEVSSMEQITAENLIDALLKHNIVSLGTKVNSFEETEEDGVKTLHLDLSKTFHEYLKTMTKEGEKIIMYSVAATFLDAYDAEEIVITVDGSVLETENATYDAPLKYTPGKLKTAEE